MKENTTKFHDNGESKLKHAESIIDNLGEMFRQIIRVFMDEGKVHIGLLMQKLFMMFVAFFDKL